VSKLAFVKRGMGHTNEQQRHFSEWPISELHGGGRFHPNQFKTTPYPPAIMECRLCFSAQART